MPQLLQGVTKERIRRVLGAFVRVTEDLVDVVYALLDPRESWFGGAKPGTRLCDGATTAHLACHVGILQRGSAKLDREGRDYWIKPLRESGAVESVFLRTGIGDFVAGHPVPKSSNCAYRLNHSFVALLQAPEAELPRAMSAWLDADATRARLAFSAIEAAKARALVDTKHSDLISTCRSVFVPRFLPDFEVVYTDEGDGDRIGEEQSERLLAAGLVLQLGDAMPDILLWHREQDTLWVVEAVVSDGEVDFHKVESLVKFAKRCGKRGIGFTTAYWSWKDAASRQERHQNIAPRTYVWIATDPAKHWRADDLPITVVEF